ncbi:MAG: tetratricopeptide repeat protein [Gemmatimonadota bacterium]|jgi:thioredoxin-like negative regulator of GroEL
MFSRILRLGVPALALGLVAGTAAAQQAAPQPQCHLSYRSNFRLNGAQQYLDQVQRSRFEDDRQRHLASSMRVLTEAAQAGNADQLTLWYFFGQTYLAKHDLPGADSSFRKAEALGDADCRRAVDRLRRNEYVPIQNLAVEQIQGQHYDSALALLRRAHVIYRSEPNSFANMASIFSQQDATDSAVTYYRRAAAAGEDPRRDELRTTSLLNAARLLHRADRFAAADSAYREYLRRKPRDMEALTSLASVLSSLNRTEEAAAIYDSILAHPDSLGSFELFETGVALFRQNRYQIAAQAFQLGLQKNPLHRDALFNLANTYVAGNDTARALPAAKRLVAVDSMNRSSIRLLAAAYQRVGAGARAQDSILRARRDTSAARFRRIYQAYADSTLRQLQRQDSLPWEISVQRFEPRDSTATLRGVIQNLQSRQQRAFVFVLEFVDSTGAVIGHENVEIPDLSPLGEPGNQYDFNIIASGRGILAYRYRTN